ncbi:hypothetical protein HETIRDRAFT_103972 [Heterobasidion irregulare TC 32-1]|uniref:Uncharacterized protein n=1 Tax=Heterobasidion irregulare (strain TC 32-1) TaxID=747525 RepID=W4JYB7_HETIT|nr:uncharacterized protein HETIRDRAFT_103972 [Heterobasidion irregulare TC 32-1]ETW78572.1 hypothetical protein HETIRDRAFT_103972 [Heterobasidion irregulare TC 32-1]
MSSATAWHNFLLQRVCPRPLTSSSLPAFCHSLIDTSDMDPEVIVTHTPTSSVSSTEPQFRASTPPSPPSRAGSSTLPVPFSQTDPYYRLYKADLLLYRPKVVRLRAQSEPDVREALEAREAHEVRETFRLLEADHRPEVKKVLRDVVRLLGKVFQRNAMVDDFLACLARWRYRLCACYP